MGGLHISYFFTRTQTTVINRQEMTVTMTSVRFQKMFLPLEWTLVTRGRGKCHSSVER